MFSTSAPSICSKATGASLLLPALQLGTSTSSPSTSFLTTKCKAYISDLTWRFLRALETHHDSLPTDPFLLRFHDGISSGLPLTPGLPPIQASPISLRFSLGSCIHPPGFNHPHEDSDWGWDHPPPSPLSWIQTTYRTSRLETTAISHATCLKPTSQPFIAVLTSNALLPEFHDWLKEITTYIVT